ncbi:phosphotransferase family protein [Arthrobacter sp. G119Y2]|uniref:phosphotransferase family protein n=1 Tax=Arthrobacter sp. G119Y2 TaxID=3134965 RepID=UPI00311A858E
MDRSPGGLRGAAEAASKAVLEGPGMSGPLAAAVRPLGLRPVSWVHLRSHHRPGAGISALYRVEAVPRSGSAGKGQQVRLHVGATTAELGGAGGPVVRAEAGSTAVRLWVHPRDPVLTGLPWATDAGAVARGVFGAGAAGARAELKLVAYRPLRRAVVRAGYEGSSAYLKVPQPRLADGLRRRLRLAADAGLPVPPLLATASDAGPAAAGVLVLGALPGQSLHRELRTAGNADWDPALLTRLLDQLPAAAMALPRRAAWSERILDYGAGAATALPEGAERIIRCAEGVAGMVRSTDPGPLVPSHGDFHGGNLLAGGGGLQITGLLDVDALGPGHRVDDLACFLGHLRVLAALAPENAALGAAAERSARVFIRSTGAAALYSRAAGVALTLVAGAAGRGPDAAQRTLAAAEELLALSRSTS